MEQTDSVSSLKGVGEKTEKLLAKLSIFTVADLLTHFPKNYDVYEKICPIALLEEGKKAAVEGTLMNTPSLSKRKDLTILQVRLRDASGSVLLTRRTMMTGI